jgi:hypothetical protein
MEYIKNIPHTDSSTSYQSKTLLELSNNVSNDLIQELFNSIMNDEITLLEVSQLPSIEPHTITRLLTSKSAYFKKEINIKKFALLLVKSRVIESGQSLFDVLKQKQLTLDVHSLNLV